MTRSESETTRQEYERRRAEAAMRRKHHARAKSERDEGVQRALARYASKPPAPRAYDGGGQVVFERAPRLAVQPYTRGIEQMLKLPAIRPVNEWTPRGKGRETLFRSLCDHLLAKYPVPAILWSGFLESRPEPFVPLVAHVAQGGSLFAYVKEAAFAVPLTRRMCHDVLTTPSSGTLLAAIRRAEVRSVGGDERLAQAWLATQVAQSLGRGDDEAFWLTVLEWFAKVPGWKPSQVAPLVDYIGHRRGEDGRFSMRGRSLQAMTRAMSTWHRELAHLRVVRAAIFETSGFKSAKIDRSERGRDGQLQRRIWRVDEILSTQRLAGEGRRMNHCVYSYAAAIERKQTSIWSMTLEDGRGETGRWAVLTIEVRNALRRVVQARGRFNRTATSEEHAILMRWAGMNGLEISLGRWG
jgi:hypothetical protein